MKILNAIHLQKVGGVDEMFRNYAIALKNAGHEVALLVSQKSNVKDYKGIKTIFKLKNISQFLDFLHLLFILIIFRPNIVICHAGRNMKWMKIISKFTRIKSVAVTHGATFKKSLNCEYIININKQINEDVIKSGFDKNKTFVVGNVIEVSQEYKRRNFNYKNPKIAIFGRIEYQKGFDILIKACAELKNQDFSIKIGGFEIEGENHLQEIKNLAQDLKIADKCEHYGIVRDKSHFLEDVDILIVSSREEAFGLVVLEGFEHGVLTISSDTIGGKMHIDHQENGLLFKNEDHIDLKEKIEFAIKNHQNYQEYTKNAYEKLLKDYNFVNFQRNLENVLQKIAK